MILIFTQLLNKGGGEVGFCPILNVRYTICMWKPDHNNHVCFLNMPFQMYSPISVLIISTLLERLYISRALVILAADVGRGDLV